LLLVIDVGNTNIVLGVYDGDKLKYDWRIATQKDRTSDEYGLVFDQIFQYHCICKKEIKAIIISSVVPTLMHTLPSMCQRYFSIDPLIVGETIDPGINVLLDNPKEVGADRVVNAVAGYEKYGGPLIIVDSGTAITLDVVSENGDYLGGVITPGIKISSEALFLRTAKLPKVEIIKPDTVIGKNTIESIQAGIVNGFVGLVDHLIELIITEMGLSADDVKLVATGGFSQILTQDSKYITIIDKLITLDGLRMIYERNL